MRDEERSARNFSPEDRQRRKDHQRGEELQRLRAQLETQERSMMQLTSIVLEEAPQRLAEIGLTEADAREFIRGLNR